MGVLHRARLHRYNVRGGDLQVAGATDVDGDGRPHFKSITEIVSEETESLAPVLH